MRRTSTRTNTQQPDREIEATTRLLICRQQDFPDQVGPIRNCLPSSWTGHSSPPTGWPNVTPTPTMTCGTPASTTHDGNLQVVAVPTGQPLWTSEVFPGSVHDLTAARECALPARPVCPSRQLPVLADKGYLSAGAEVHTRSHTRQRSGATPGQPGLQHLAHLATRPRRTRPRRAVPTLTRPATHHPRPLPHRRYHPRRPRPSPTSNNHKITEKTPLSPKPGPLQLTIRAFGGLPVSSG